MNIMTVIYCIYLLYVISLAFDWDLSINMDYAIWALIITLIITIFFVCLIASLYIEGSKLGNVSGTTLAITLVMLVLTAGLVLFYQLYRLNKIRSNVGTKLAIKKYTPLIYHYGEDSQEIGIRLQQRGTPNFPTTETKTLQELIETIMTDRTHEKVKSTIDSILGTSLNASIDVYYNLLWYFCISENPFGNRLNTKEVNYIISLNQEELITALGIGYNGARDRASLLFAALSGQYIPNPGELERYNDIKEYDANIVYNLSFVHNKIIDHQNGTYSSFGPYIYLALQAPTAIETIIKTMEDENPYDIIDKLGIGPIQNISTMSHNEILTYLRGELSLYHNVFTRPDGHEHPIDLRNKSREEIMTILCRYTNNELIQAYEPRFRWNSRTELLRLITDDILGGSKWSISSVGYCTNDNTLNIITGDTHGEMNKHDETDPTLSFGIQKNYRCFQASELEGCFREYDGVFMFRDPDWIPGSNNPKDFSLESIKALQTLLHEEQHRYAVDKLLIKINYGLECMKSAAMQIQHLKNQMTNFTLEQKNIIELYLAWMFTYSMWMRFWKGPGNPWPMVKVNVGNARARVREARSSPDERDEHIFIQECSRTMIIEMYERDIQLKEWIESLPTIYYDFDSLEASCASHTIKSILDSIAIGNYCMGFGSDTILKTAYYYITKLLDYPEGYKLDEFISRFLPQLNDMEYTNITNQLTALTEQGMRMNILHTRLNILQGPMLRQPSFRSTNYENNVHVE